jgi:hypothetical protein
MHFLPYQQTTTFQRFIPLKPKIIKTFFMATSTAALEIIIFFSFTRKKSDWGIKKGV